MYNLQESLKVVTGMDAITLQPAAGAHGELCGMMIVKKYFENFSQNILQIQKLDISLQSVSITNGALRKRIAVVLYK